MTVSRPCLATTDTAPPRGGAWGSDRGPRSISTGKGLANSTWSSGSLCSKPPRLSNTARKAKASAFISAYREDRWERARSVARTFWWRTLHNAALGRSICGRFRISRRFSITAPFAAHVQADPRPICGAVSCQTNSSGDPWRGLISSGRMGPEIPLADPRDASRRTDHPTCRSRFRSLPGCRIRLVTRSPPRSAPARRSR
jgi:hypothetical protein